MTKRALRVAMIGSAFMGRAHSQAWRTAQHFFDLPLEPELALLVGRDAATTAERAGTLGWRRWSTDWREAVADPEIDLIDICTPGDTHAEIAIAALEAGKHVALREAARELRRRGRARWPRPPERRTRRGRDVDVRLQLPPHPRARARAAHASPMAGSGGSGTCARSTCRTGCADAELRRSTWRLDQEQGRFGRARRHRGAQHRHRAVAHRTVTSPRSSAHAPRTFVTRTARRDRGRCGLGGRGGDARCDAGRVTRSTTRWPSPRRSPAAGAAATFEADRAMATGQPQRATDIETRTASSGSGPFDFERHERVCEYFDGRGDDPDAEGFRTRPTVTDPTHPWTSNWWPTGARDRLRAPVHPPGGRARPRHRGRSARLAVLRRGPRRPTRTRRHRGERIRQITGDARGKAARMTARTALIVRGGWEGHQPVEATELFLPVPRAQRLRRPDRGVDRGLRRRRRDGRHRPRRAVRHDVADHRASRWRD